MYKMTYDQDGRAKGIFQLFDPSGVVLILERTDLADRDQRLNLAGRVAGIAKISTVEAEKRLMALAAEALARQREAKAKPEPKTPPSWEPGSKAKQEAERLLERPELLAKIADTVNILGVTGERALIALAYLTATSRLLEKPLYLLIQGEPASGKSYILQTVCQTLPPNLVEIITDVTAEALYYLSEATTLKNKVLLLGERRRQRSEESTDTTKSIRELHEAGRLSKLVPVKEGGRLRTVRLEIVGAPAILESCSHSMVPLEDLSRTILAWTDESAEQTRRVLMDFAQRRASGGQVLSPERLETIQAIQWLLEPFPVSIPYLPALAERFPAQQTEARRAFVRLAAVTEASCLLHQRQRRLEEDKLIAEEDDFKLAWRLLAPWLRVRLAEGPTPSVQRVWAAIRDKTGPLSQMDLTKMGLGSRPTIGKALSYLERAGAIAFLENEPGKPRRFRVIQPDWNPEDLNLSVGL